MKREKVIVEVFISNNMPFTVHCAKHIFSMTRHNAKTRREFMKHQVLPSPPERSETEREGEEKDKEWRRNHFLLLGDKRKG